MPPSCRSVKSEGDPAELSDRVGGSLHRPILLFVGTMTAKHNAVAARWLIDVLAPSLADTATIVICGPGSDRLVGSGKAGAPSRVARRGGRHRFDHRDRRSVPRSAGDGRRSQDKGSALSGAWSRELLERPSRSKGSSGAPGLVEAPLDVLPELVARMIEVPETAAVTRSRVAAQREWLTLHHGRPLIIDQWRNVLTCVNGK